MHTMKLFDGLVATKSKQNNWIVDTIKNILQSYLKRKIYKDTIKELSQLSPRELNDIGITHYDIREIARETAYGNVFVKKK